jgi:hypothetical protein
MNLTPDLAGAIDLSVFIPHPLDLHREDGITPGTLG